MTNHDHTLVTKFCKIFSFLLSKLYAWNICSIFSHTWLYLPSRVNRSHHS